MSWQDRDYNQVGFGGSGGGGMGGGMGGAIGGRMAGCGVVKWLLIVNVALLVWNSIFGGSLRGNALALWPYTYFSVDKAIYGGQVWRFLTYQFIHAGFWHLFGNMIGLFFFGPLMERWWGSKRFLAFYLLCGVSGAVVGSLLGAIPGLHILPSCAKLVGASGALFGILVGCAVCYPHMRVMLIFPPIPMTMRTMALIFLGISALAVLAGSGNAGGDAAHLGGAILGFALITRPRSLDWADRLSPSAIQAGSTAGRWQKKLDRRRSDEAEVDRILDKVRKKGLGSLSRKEKKTLNDATDRQKRVG